jgi:hypothetical protein
MRGCRRRGSWNYRRKEGSDGGPRTRGTMMGMTTRKYRRYVYVYVYVCLVINEWVTSLCCRVS